MSCSPGSIHGLPAVIRSAAMRRVMEMVKRVAQTDASVLITGESGVGKELVARALHEQSLRCNSPWVDLNCGALPEHLVESELFGFEKGAFSGATQTKQGLLELAHPGTLFLDEIGDLDSRLQVKLLRVLDGAPYYRLGGLKKISPDVRIVAATNRDLEKDIAGGKFRSDLFHRLSQVHIAVPPLRERPEDIPVLAEFFLREQNQNNVGIAPAALEELRNLPWPGNVRELRNVVIRASIMRSGNEIQVEDLPLGKQKTSPQSAPVAASLEEMERQMIFRALDQTSGHHERAAKVLGISRRTLTRKLKKYEAANALEAVAAG
jgi:two-component system, NtrC family, response regulator PilR